MAPGSQFRVGDAVSGKWPGNNLYYPAKVTKIMKDGQYELQFKDGSTRVLPSRDIAPESTPAATDKERTIERLNPTEQILPRSYLSIFSSLVLTLAAPVLVFWVNLSCDREECSVHKLPKFPRNITDYINPQSVFLYLGWIAFQVFLACLPVGEEAEGQSLRDGSRLKYRLNGLHALAITMAVLITLAYYEIPIDIIFENYMQLVITSIVVSFLTSFLLLIRSRKLSKNRITEPNVARNAVYDFFIGRELNPQIGDFDLKFFTILRPGLIGWAVLNACMLWTEFLENGYYFYPNIWLVGVSQFLYVMDAFVFEESILSTWDVTTEGLGFLLVFGNLTFAPFIFTLPVRYLLLYRAQLNNFALGAISLVNLLGYIICRGSNKQKDDFRRNPYDGKFMNSRTIPTKSTQRILIDGWWARLRHPNYLGDLMIALSWSLPCGFSHVIPYTYFVYLAVLLIHRAHRDHKMCERKYGNAWQVYCDQVPYKIIPPFY